MIFHIWESFLLCTQEIGFRVFDENHFQESAPVRSGTSTRSEATRSRSEGTSTRSETTRTMSVAPLEPIGQLLALLLQFGLIIAAPNRHSGKVLPMVQKYIKKHWFAQWFTPANSRRCLPRNPYKTCSLRCLLDA